MYASVNVSRVVGAKGFVSHGPLVEEEANVTWIPIVDDDANSDVVRAVKTWTSVGRPVPGVIAPMKHAPRTLRGVMAMNGAVTFGGSCLGRTMEEWVAVAVSAVNECFY